MLFIFTGICPFGGGKLIVQHQFGPRRTTSSKVQDSKTQPANKTTSVAAENPRSVQGSSYFILHHIHILLILYQTFLLLSVCFLSSDMFLETRRKTCLFCPLIFKLFTFLNTKNSFDFTNLLYPNQITCIHRE